MATFQSWAWLGGTLTGPITQSNLGGTFVPVSNYTQDFIFVDGNNNGVIGDLDGTSAPVATDGVEVNGVFRQFQQFTTWTSSTITYSDGTTENIVVHVYQLDNGDLTYRLSDPEVEQVLSAGYSLADIETIQLGTLSDFSSRFESLDPTNHNDFVCFVAGTVILTEDGEMPIEDLSEGDLVKTLDASFLPVRWVGKTVLGKQELETSPNLQPIRIKSGALGGDIPNKDLLVSPQHRVLVRSKIAQRLFDTSEVLVAAKHLLDVEGIEVAHDLDEVEYVHFLLDMHQVVFSNGAETETLYPGPQALKSIGEDALEEIYSIFPELRHLEAINATPSARRLLRGAHGRELAWRHSKNQRELVSQRG